VLQTVSIAKEALMFEYNWDKWFSKKQVTLKKGKDFKCQVHGMANQIRNKAAKRGVSISLKIRDDGEIEISVANPQKVK
jgi:hypothetical protein